MSSAPPSLAPADRSRLEQAGRAAFPDFALEVLARTSSTQDRVRLAARRGALAGWCCVASEQTAGRGRQNRAWVAEPASALLASILVRPEPPALSLLTLIAGVAAVDALRSTTRVAARLKWPNDVLVDGAKLAGILGESTDAASEPGAIVLGIGINLSAERFPPGARGTSLHRLVPEPPTWHDLLGAWLRALGDRLSAVERDGPDPLLAAWRERATGLGERVRMVAPDGERCGRALDVDADGALLVETSDGTVRWLAGDVHLEP